MVQRQETWTSSQAINFHRLLINGLCFTPTSSPTNVIQASQTLAFSNCANSGHSGMARSLEIAQVKMLVHVDKRRCRQLLTLSSTALQKRPQRQKRKRSLSDDSCLDEQTRSKRPQARPKRCEHSAEYLLGPAAHWATTRGWSRTFKDEDCRGSQANSKPAKEYVDVPLETFGSAIGEWYLCETLSFLLQAE